MYEVFLVMIYKSLFMCKYIGDDKSLHKKFPHIFLHFLWEMLLRWNFQGRLTGESLTYI